MKSMARSGLSLRARRAAAAMPALPSPPRLLPSLCDGAATPADVPRSLFFVGGLGVSAPPTSCESLFVRGRSPRLAQDGDS